MGIGDRRKHVFGPDFNLIPRSAIAMPSRRAITILTLILVTCFLFLLASRNVVDTSYYPRRPHFMPQPSWTSRNGASSQHSQFNSTLDQPTRARDPICDAFPDTSNILLVMKTGATESFDKVPTQLMTVLRCLPEFFIFSDLEQTIAGTHIRDSLDTVLEKAKLSNPDFDLYNRQRECAIDQDTCNKNHDGSSEGWNLDKYKNIHIAEKTYNLRPDYDWYIFIDADTYVLWPTLVQWLRKLKPSKKHYLGSVTLINNFPFGHGGSGYILSQASMADFIGKNPGVANDFDVQAHSECCGDYLLAKAMKEKSGLKIKQTWPTINGEKPHTLPYGPSHWCHPIVTMHHMNSEEVSSFWNFESQRYAREEPLGSPKPMLIKDIYYEFFEKNLQDTRDDWDNLSDDRLYLNATAKNYEDWQVDRMPKQEEMSATEKEAHMSFEHCRKACEHLEGCYQYKFTDGICGISWAFKFGHPVKTEQETSQRSLSGWCTEKISKFIKDQGDCKKIHWPDA